MEKKASRKYIVIAKVGQFQFVKYRCNDLQNFIKFITSKFPGVMYFNVFSNTGINKNKMLYTWGKNKGLQNSY